jgi:tetratricopeptide (TPR) repeat protein
MLEGGALRALGEYDHAIDSYLRSLNIFINLRHRRDAAEVLNRLGAVCYFKGADEDALSYYERARKFYRRWSMIDKLSMVEMNIGGLFARKGDHLKAIEYYKKAMGNYWRISKKRAEILCLNAIAHSYMSIGDYDSAAVFLDQARELAEKIEDDGKRTETIFFMGCYYCEKKEFGNALKLFSQVEEKAETFNRKDLLVQVYCEKAWVFYEQNDVENAERYVSKVLETSAGLSKYFHARSLLLLSKIQDSTQAFKNATEALDIAEDLHERFLKILCFNELALISHELRNLDKAREFFEEAVRIAASIAENLGELKSKYYQKAEIRNLLDGYVNFMMETEGKPLEQLAEENKLVKEVLFDGYC